jgi:hypothetical protein
MGKSGFIEDGRYYEVPVPDESIYVAAPIEAIPIGVLPTGGPPPPAEQATWPKVTLAVLVVLVVAAGAVLAYVLARPTGPNTAGQIAACRELVKQNLKAPATAQFSDEAVAKQPTGGLYEIHGLVDAQNSFGALLRQRYTCTVTVDGKALSASLSAWS